MKRLLLVVFVCSMVVSCAPEEDNTRSSSYLLHRANYNPVKGEIVVTELAPGKLQFHIQLENTSEGYVHPAHLHFGDISEVGELAFRLEPVDGATGESLTVLDQQSLPDGSLLTYDSFLDMDGSIKIHMNDGYFKHMVLAFGNVGQNEDYLFDGVAVCTGH
ncbi:hypothetical protein [Marinoscillum furvescens]|uniref:CHRD domain-containing protein n=1 Tax=Marinoscillum furvescens DSM 4134 TaxID=1122208 RepID=A0A3D9L1R2_MARFU|nr:hypothetical protein [Marinoscillum furvescens]RED97037.1 hypothetical protein C7460_11386 [Marinoscillum furvescens DSM 4134]